MGAKKVKSKQKKNVWQRGKLFYVRYKEGGKDRYIPCGSDRQKAELLAAELDKRKIVDKMNMSNEAARLFKKTETLTFKQAADEYLASRDKLKAASLRNYQNYLDNHLIPIFGDRDLRSFNETDVEHFYAEIRKDHSKKHCSDILAFAKAVCALQIEREKIQRNPFNLPRLHRQANTSIEEDEEAEEKLAPFSPDEIERVLKALPDHWRPIFTVLAFTGMRPSEAFALRWKDIDWQDQTLRVKRARVRGIEDTPKTFTSKREVKLTSRVIQVLKELKANRKIQDQADHVFLQADGRPIDRYLCKPWNQVLTAV